MNQAAERTRMVVQEFEWASFGDARLSYRVQRIAKAVAAQPALSFPQALATEAELEGLYRFLRNDKVTPETIQQPHEVATVQRIAEHKEALAVHDNTEFRFSGQGRAGLGKVGRTGNGFMAQFCLALASDGTRDPLGILDVDHWVRTGKSPTQKRKKEPNRYKQLRAQPSEQDRWFEMVERAEQRVGDKASLIHLMDSEADDYLLLWKLHSRGRRFVMRLCYDRRLDSQATGSLPGEKTREFIARAEALATRHVKLARRTKRFIGGRARTAPRPPRLTTLSFSARTVVVRRPSFCPTEASKTLSVNIVAVSEKKPPKGLEPVDWLLLTSEPISTEEEILKVVDAYRARWAIEEYFGALKSGCAFEDRQLESKSTILKALALFTPVAWALLRMRTLSRLTRKTPIGRVLSRTQMKIIRKKTGIPLRWNSSAQDAFLAVARLGGHLKHNGPPGWRVLGRGYSQLLTLEIGFKIAKTERSDQW
jgi:hypothetical protein